jgi:hypothetical protein
MSERCFNSTMSEVVQRSVTHAITPLSTGEGLAKRRLVAGARSVGGGPRRAHRRPQLHRLQGGVLIERGFEREMLGGVQGGVPKRMVLKQARPKGSLPRIATRPQPHGTGPRTRGHGWSRPCWLGSKAIEFRGNSLAQDFRGKFNNISRIMDCVTCESCKMHVRNIRTVPYPPHACDYYCAHVPCCMAECAAHIARSTTQRRGVYRGGGSAGEAEGTGDRHSAQGNTALHATQLRYMVCECWRSGAWWVCVSVLPVAAERSYGICCTLQPTILAI